MTKKHFEAIAAILKSANDEVPNGVLNDFDSGHQTAVETIINDLMDYFAADNPRFNRDQFLTACGIG